VRAALVIAARSLRQRLRDRSAILFALVVPFGLAAAFSLLLPRGVADFHTSWVVVDADRGPVSQVLVDHVLGSLRAAGVVDLTEAPSEAAAEAAVDAGTAHAAIVIPAGFSDAVGAGRATQLRIVGRPDTHISVDIARSALGGFASEVGAIELAVATTLGEAWEPGDPLDPTIVAEVRDLPSPVTVDDTAVTVRQADSSTHYAASMAIMFLFFATSFGPIGLVAERRAGTLARLLAAPIRPGSIVAGVSITAFVLGLVSMFVLVLGTTLLLGARWGPPELVMSLGVAAVVAATGLSMLICTLARTEEQAGAWNAIVAITLAVLGGAMIPLTVAPDVLVAVSQVTPHAWFLRAVDALSGEAADVIDVLPAIVVLVGFGAITGAVGLARARSSLVAR
jgi:ABC-2 type transport system permease protein